MESKSFHFFNRSMEQLIKYVDCNITVARSYITKNPKGQEIIELIQKYAYRQKIDNGNYIEYKHILFPYKKFLILHNNNISGITAKLNEYVDKCLTYFTDGSCNKKTGVSGYACVKIPENQEFRPRKLVEALDLKYQTLSGTVDYETQTSNTGELTGLLIALNDALIISATEKISNILLCSDSIYSINSFREWIFNWRLRNFKGVKNLELIKKIDKTITELESKNIQIYFEYVPGHANIYFNEVCDQLAKKAVGLN